MPDPRKLRSWQFPAAVGVFLFGVAFTLQSINATIGLRDARNQVAQFQEQASCRSDLNSAVSSARSSVEAIDGQIIATMGRTFAEGLTGGLADERRAQLQQLFRDQLDARESLQTLLDDELARLEQADQICPG